MLVRRLFVCLRRLPINSMVPSISFSQNLATGIDESKLYQQFTEATKENDIKQLIGHLGVISKTWNPTDRAFYSLTSDQCDKFFMCESTKIDDVIDILRVVGHWRKEIPLNIDIGNYFMQWLRQNVHKVEPKLYTQILRPLGQLHEDLRPSVRLMCELADRGSTLLPDADQTCMVDYLWVFGKCGLSLQDLKPEAIPVWFDLSKPQINEWDGNSVTSVLVALAREKLEPPQDWWNVFCKRLLEIKDYRPQSCSNMLHSFAILQLKTKFRFEPDLLKYVTEKFVEMLDQCDQQGTANGIWALGKLKYDPSCVVTDFWTRYWTVFEASLINLYRVHLIQHMTSWYDFRQVPPPHIKDKLETHLLTFDLDSVSNGEESSILYHLFRLQNAAVLQPSENLLRQYLTFLDRSILLQNQNDELIFSSSFNAVASAYSNGICCDELNVNFWPYYWSYLWTNYRTYNFWIYFASHAKLWVDAKVSPDKQLVAKLEKHLMTQDLYSRRILIGLIKGLIIIRGRFFSSKFNRFAAQLVIDHLDELGGSRLIHTLTMFECLKIDPSTLSKSFWPCYWNAFAEKIHSTSAPIAHLLNYCIRTQLSLPKDIEDAIINHLCSLEMNSVLLWQFVRKLSGNKSLHSLPPKLSSHLIQSFDRNMLKFDVASICLVSPMLTLGWLPKNQEQFWNDFWIQSSLVLPLANSQQVKLVLKAAFVCGQQIEEKWFEQAINAIEKKINVVDARVLLHDVAHAHQLPFSPNQFDILTKTLANVLLDGLDKSFDIKSFVNGVSAFQVLGIMSRHSLSHTQWKQFWEITERNIGRLSPRIRRKLINWVGKKALNPPHSCWKKLKDGVDPSTRTFLLDPSASNSHNWNTLFLGANAVADAIAAKMDAKKSELLDSQSDKSLGVRMALGETRIVRETREFLLSHGVQLDAFSKPDAQRSNNIILVKNLPIGTDSDELRKIFSKYGEVGRLVLPPDGGISALIEFNVSQEAKVAFKALAYSRFKSVPLYLEWAPGEVFTTEAIAQNEEKEKAKKEADSAEKEEEAIDDTTIPEPSIAEPDGPEPETTLFVKNLNFETQDETLQECFEKCGRLVYATVSTKRDAKRPGQMLSMGYGFVQFKRRADAQKAIKELQGTLLNGHSIELKQSHRDMTEETTTKTRKPVENLKQGDSTKLMVRNIPFQASEKELSELFGAFGELRSLRLPKKVSESGEKHKGFCFVDFLTKNDAKRAFDALCHSTHLYGRRLVLEWANESEGLEELRKKTAEHFETGANRKKRGKEKRQMMQTLEKTLDY